MTTLNYIVMSSPRTGSSMLCAALSDTSLAGKPAEFMHKKTLKNENHPEADAETLTQYIKKFMSENVTSNGVFGMKMHFNQFGNLFSQKQNGFKRGLEFLGNFQKFILIYRHDKLLQAISEMLASESDLWGSDEEKSRFSLGRPFQESDVLTISRILNRQIHEEYAWRDILQQLGVNFHSVKYEDLAGATKRELQGVKEYLGIKELEPVELVAKMVKLADPTIAQRMKHDYLNAIGSSTPRFPPDQI
ncbi:MAG: Stf0 family sulfotransferase [Aestuariivirga sp.]|nr:Stf0 family sulfotransferase [Aestuariivirga sp.]